MAIKCIFKSEYAYNRHHVIDNELRVHRLTWRSADKDLGVALANARDRLLDQLCSDISSGSIPTISSLVNNIGDLELVRVSLSIGIELVLENDVLRRDVGVDKVDLGLVGLVLKNTADDLDHRSNA